MSTQKFPFYGFTLADAGRWTFDHPDQFIMAFQVAVAGGFRVEEVHTYVQQPDEPVIDAQEFADWAASTDPADDDDSREAACVAACEGISTAQLQAMNETAPGTLSRAYDVCSEIRESHGEALDDDSEISGSDAVDTLCRVASDVNAVVTWAFVDSDEGDDE